MVRAALLASAAALLASVAPAGAAGTRACGAGYVGVVVYDANGDLATACVRTTEVTELVREGWDGVTAYAGELRAWVADAPPECEWTEHGIRCTAMEPPPLPRFP